MRNVTSEQTVMESSALSGYEPQNLLVSLSSESDDGIASRSSVAAFFDYTLITTNA
jgi:hypothetical protein